MPSRNGMRTCKGQQQQFAAAFFLFSSFILFLFYSDNTNNRPSLCVSIYLCLCVSHTPAIVTSSFLLCRLTFFSSFSFLVYFVQFAPYFVAGAMHPDGCWQ